MRIAFRCCQSRCHPFCLISWLHNNSGKHLVCPVCKTSCDTAYLIVSGAQQQYFSFDIFSNKYINTLGDERLEYLRRKWIKNFDQQIIHELEQWDNPTKNEQRHQLLLYIDNKNDGYKVIDNPYYTPGYTLPVASYKSKEEIKDDNKQTIMKSIVNDDYNNGVEDDDHMAEENKGYDHEQVSMKKITKDDNNKELSIEEQMVEENKVDDHEQVSMERIAESEEVTV